MDGTKKRVVEVMTGNDIERLTGRVELKDATAIRLGEIHRVAGNRIKYLLQISDELTARLTSLSARTSSRES